MKYEIETFSDGFIINMLYNGVHYKELIDFYSETETLTTTDLNPTLSDKLIMNISMLWSIM